MTILDFDLGEAEAVQDWQPLPPGKYLLQVQSEALKESPKGRAVQVSFQVAEGQAHARRFVNQRYFIEHSNATAQNIGRAKLKALSLAALGRTTNNLDELVGKFIGATIGLDKPYVNNKGETVTNNVITRYEAPDGGAPLVAGTVQKPAAKTQHDLDMDDVNF